MQVPALPEFENAENRRTIAPGEVIFTEGQTGDCAYIVLTGEVQVMVDDPSGRKLTLNRIQAGEMFGEMALLTKFSRRTASTISAEGCDLLVVGKNVFEKHLNEADPFLRFVIEHLCKLVELWTNRVRKA